MYHTGEVHERDSSGRCVTCASRGESGILDAVAFPMLFGIFLPLFIGLPTALAVAATTERMQPAGYIVGATFMAVVVMMVLCVLVAAIMCKTERQ